MSTPLVSVIVPAFNAEEFIAQTIESVLRQTLADFQLVIADDKSTDRTSDIVAGYAAADKRIRHIRLPQNLGPGGARNAALEAATGAWIAVLDADDWYQPDRLEKMISAAEREGTPLAADNQRFITSPDGAGEELLIEDITKPFSRFTADDMLKGDQLNRTSRNTGLLKPVMRRDFLRANGINYDREVTLGEDFYFLLKCLRYTPFLIFLSEPLYNYRWYVPGTHTKRQTMKGFLAMRTLHARYQDLFSPATFPTTARLMEQRRQEIEKYIRFKQFIQPIKSGKPLAFMIQAARDPGGLVLLGQKVAGDPAGAVGQAGSLIRGANRRLMNLLKRKPGMS
jgi:succinoglycan biosynthesis protein ExoO